nr:MAG TPA: hypothetical protein [Caudoviricetes sp.]
MMEEMEACMAGSLSVRGIRLDAYRGPCVSNSLESCGC